MALRGGFAGKLQKTGQDALDKTKKTAETVKLRSAISDLEKENHSVYTDIGRTYFLKYAQNVPDEEMLSYCQKIKDNMAKIESLQEEIRMLKGMVKCKNCGGDVSADASFCKHCGANLMPEIPSSKSEAQIVRKCAACGQILEENALFCVACGQKVEIEGAPAESGSEETALREEAVLSDDNMNPDEQSMPDSVKLTCMDCGTPLTVDDIFCPNCGRKVETV